METRAPSTSFMDLTQEATTSQQPPSRFRPCNYTVDLSNTTNPPPPQVMVKPAVMLRRDERPEPVSFSVTDAAQLSRTLSEMGSGSGIPEATYSELAAILLSSGRIKQLISPPKSWPSPKEYTRYSLSRGPGGSAPPSASRRARLDLTTNTPGLTAHLRVAY